MRAEQAFRKVYERDFDAGGRALCRVALALLRHTDYDAEDKRFIRAFVGVAKRVADGTESMFVLDDRLPRSLEPYLGSMRYYFIEDDHNLDYGTQTIRQMLSVAYPPDEPGHEQARRRASERLAKVIVAEA